MSGVYCKTSHPQVLHLKVPRQQRLGRLWERRKVSLAQPWDSHFYSREQGKKLRHDRTMRYGELPMRRNNIQLRKLRVMSLLTSSS